MEREKLFSWCRFITVALTGVALVGCVGGGGGSHNPDPGMVIHPDAADALLYVDCKGQVLVVGSNGQTSPLSGALVTVMSGGVAVSSAVTNDRGVYHVRMKRSQENSVEASKRGYALVSPPLVRTPQRGEVLPTMEMQVRRITMPEGGEDAQVPGGGNVQIPGGVGRPAVMMGTVGGRLMASPQSGALDAILYDQVVQVRDASTNRVVRSLRVDNANRFSYEGPVGQQVIIEPVATHDLRWQPRSKRVTIGQTPQSYLFSWTLAGGSSNAPAPRPVINRPPPSLPTPTPAPAINRPFLRVPQ